MNTIKMKQIMDELIHYLNSEKMNGKYTQFIYNFNLYDNYKTNSIQRFNQFIDYVHKYVNLIDNFDSDETIYDIMLSILYNLKFTDLDKEKLFLLKDNDQIDIFHIDMSLLNLN